MNKTTLHTFELTGMEEVSVSDEIGSLIQVQIVEPDDSSSGVVLLLPLEMAAKLSSQIREAVTVVDNWAGRERNA